MDVVSVHFVLFVLMAGGCVQFNSILFSFCVYDIRNTIINGQNIQMIFI